MAHELIDLLDWGSMPFPLDTREPGEAWIWGDFVLALQVRPITCANAARVAMGKPPAPAVEYPYALSVFYRKQRNPHGPSVRPVLVVTVEQSSLALLWAVAVANDPSLVGKRGKDGSKELPEGADRKDTYLGMFTATGRKNLGHCERLMPYPEVRMCLLELAGSWLGLTGEPTKIGTVANVHGHPDTGWAPQPPPRRGCGRQAVMLLLALGGCVALLLAC